VYTSLMDERSVHPTLALPGRENIGLGRHWHGVSVMLWVLNGVVYALLLFATGLWRRIIPTSWDTFGEAWDTLLIYLSFDVPDLSHFSPYDPLQMLGYTFVIFILAPFMMLTGIAMSPAVRSRFPWFVKAFGGHQGARSLHFIGLVLFSGFLIIHVTLVFVMSPAVRSRCPWFVKAFGGHQGARSLHFIGLVLFSGFIIMHVTLVFVVHPEHNVVNMVFGGGEVTAARGAQGVVIMVSTI